MRKPNAIRLHLVAVTLAAVLAGCMAPPPPPPVPEGAPADFPIALYAAGEPGARIYEVDPLHSLVQVFVFRGGALARLGHDHVIAGRDLAGFISLRNDGSVTADIYQPLAAMTVDEPELREAAGFETAPSEDDRAGTQGNMLLSLGAAEYPYVKVAARMALPAGFTGETSVTAPVAVTLRDRSTEVDVPLQIDVSGDSVRVRGEFSVVQTDFGIEPFSALGGALTVQDRVEIRFAVTARGAAANRAVSD